MKASDFDYYLPQELIAQYPAAHREESRLFIVQKETGQMKHSLFPAVVEYLEQGDVLVLNDTKVIPARIWGKRKDTGGKIEVLLLYERENLTWEALVRPGRRIHEGTEISFAGGAFEAKAGEKTASGGRLLKFDVKSEAELWEKIFDIGEMPLPPYIRRSPEDLDRERYQTVYARSPGSVAAPTAGLHFTQDLLKKIREKGINLAYLVLHVGLGTFRPVKVEDLEQHQMHEEYWTLDEQNASLINEAKKAGKRVIAVGTTVVRTLESAASESGVLKPGAGWTRLFIYPGYDFKVVDGIITNFHLPRSTLLMLVCAFAGKDLILKAYRDAVMKNYRFFSYGDAMMII